MTPETQNETPVKCRTFWVYKQWDEYAVLEYDDGWGRVIRAGETLFELQPGLMQALKDADIRTLLRAEETLRAAGIADLCPWTISSND